MVRYKLTIEIENESDDANEEEIIKVTQCEALINKKNKHCRCFVCQKDFDLQNDAEKKQFYDTHSHQFTVNDIEIYACDEWAFQNDE